MYTAIERCRLCGGRGLKTVVDLGMQALTGVFPRAGEPQPPVGPLELVQCSDANGCRLVQLRHAFAAAEMYGENYGYRSGLNRTMVDHLRSIVEELQARMPLSAGDTVLDIGSNDGTLLSFHSRDVRRVGIDPTSSKFRRFYASDDMVISEFFSAGAFESAAGVGVKAKIITSIAMMYDLPDPLAFVRQIREVLHRDGLWCFEQSYLPSMLDTNAYDTICHEHLEYYGVRQIDWMLRESGLKIVDVELNDVNGGSFRIIAAHDEARHARSSRVDELLRQEAQRGLETTKPLFEFAQRIEQHREELRATIVEMLAAGQQIFGYGASTKGNVILQYCGIGPQEIACIAEVNEDKFGCETPGTSIPIISEKEARSRRPDVFLVLPWHFRTFIEEKEREYLQNGGSLLFPLPAIDLVTR